MVKANSNLSINLSAIVYEENGTWIAHCLELDIVAEGTSGDDSIQALVSLCDLQIKTAIEAGDLQSIFRPAPPEAWKMFSSGREKCVSEKGHVAPGTHFEAPVDRFEARRLVFA